MLYLLDITKVDFALLILSVILDSVMKIYDNLLITRKAIHVNIEIQMTHFSVKISFDITNENTSLNVHERRPRSDFHAVPVVSTNLGRPNDLSTPASI